MTWMMDGWVNVWIVGWVDDGWMDGWVVECMGRRCPVYKELIVV